MREIVPNLFYVEGRFAGHVYVAKDPDGLTLIDTSIAPAAKPILAQIAAAGYAPSDVKRILVTHAHPDHVGALHALVAATGAEVWATELEARVIESKIPVPAVERKDLQGFYKLLKMPTTWIKPPTPVAHLLTDGEVLPVLGGLTVVFTPGHAPGHVSFWHPALKLIITGDVAFNLFNRLTLPFAFFTCDMAENKRSLRKIIALKPDIACFGHGPAIMTNAAAALEQVAVRNGA